MPGGVASRNSHIRAACIVGWLAAAFALSLVVVASSDLHWGWKAFAGAPLLAAAVIAVAFFSIGFSDTIREARDVITPLLAGRYPDDKIREMIYRAGSGWALGAKALYVHSSRPYQREWKRELLAVPYDQIQSIEIHRQSGQISIRSGQDCFALFDVECRLRAEDIATQIIARARALGHEIPRMNVRSKTLLDGLGREVPPELLERFSRTLPGVKVTAPSHGLESMFEVHMERADEVDMGRRIADFEGFPVFYLVPRRYAE